VRQENEALKAAVIRKAPFTACRAAAAPGKLRVRFEVEFAQGLGVEEPRVQVDAEFNLLGAAELKALRCGTAARNGQQANATTRFSTAHLLNAQVQEVHVTTQVRGEAVRHDPPLRPEFCYSAMVLALLFVYILHNLIIYNFFFGGGVEDSVGHTDGMLAWFIFGDVQSVYYTESDKTGAIDESPNKKVKR
jgi:hypothetical protein